MSKLRLVVQTLNRREDGQTLVEYGLILSLVALTAIGGLAVLGGDVQGLYALFETVSDWMSGNGGT